MKSGRTLKQSLSPRPAHPQIREGCPVAWQKGTVVVEGFCRVGRSSQSSKIYNSVLLKFASVLSGRYLTNGGTDIRARTPQGWRLGKTS